MIETVTVDNMEEALPMYVYYLFGTFLSCIVIVAVFGNACAVYVFIRSKSLDAYHNILVCALCICSFFEGIGGTFFVAVSTFAGRWIFGQSGCSGHGFVMTFLSLTQICILSLISVIRLLTVTNSKFCRHFNGYRIYLWVLVCVFAGGVYALLPFFGWGNYHLEGLGTNCAPHWRGKSTSDVSYCIAMIVLYFVLPLGIISTSYCNVIRKLASSKRRSCRRGYVVEKHVTITVTIMIVAFLLSWTPYTVMSLYSTIGDSSDVHPVVAALPALFAKLSSIWNPIIYFVRNSRYREAFCEIFPLFRRRHVVDDSTQTGVIYQQAYTFEPREPTVLCSPQDQSNKSNFLHKQILLNVNGLEHVAKEDEEEPEVQSLTLETDV